MANSKIYGITEQDQIMRYSRIQYYVQKHRNREYNFRTREPDFDIHSDISALLPPDMSDMKRKLEGQTRTFNAVEREYMV